MMFKLFCRVFQFVMKYGSYALPWRKPLLIEGKGCITELPDRIADKGIKSVLLVTDSVIMSLGLADALLKELQRKGIHAAVYDKTVPNPTIENIEEALAMYNENGCGCIIAFGGGSPMDCAKGVGARLARPKKSVKQMKGLLKVLLRMPPLYAVPTTAGTGSEATVAAVIVDSGTHEKYAIMDPALIPHAAVLDPLLTVNLPPHITASTGMDALTHAVEAYIGRSNTRETRKMAIETVKLVFENLYTAYKEGDNIDARAKMQRAAYYGGIAFTRAYVGNVHALAHALGGRYGTAHGLANAVTLPYVLDDYGSSAFKPLSELADAVGILGENAEKKAKTFIAVIRELNALMGLPETIDGIAEGDIPALSDHAFRESNPTYPVPRIFSREDFASVYYRLMGKPGHNGYAGKMARIDLTSGEVTPFMMQKDELLNYLGGKGLAAKIIYDAFDEKVEAFSDENLIVITTSPLNASTAPSSSRFNISTISPLTGLLVSSNCGGDFGRRLRRAGYDALVISGTAPKKTYISIRESGIELRDATDIWGKSTREAQAMMGPGGKLAIGEAGENLVRYACVVCQERTAGRGGTGAVFGYKQLKGIVVDGASAAAPMPDSEMFKEFAKKWIANLKNHPLTGQQLPKLGTAALVRMMQNKGLLATRNYAAGRYENFENISGETLREKHLIKNSGCVSCSIRCARVVSHEGREIKGPELETIGLLGANLLNDDLDSIIRLNHLCDEYGIDTMSLGGAIGFAMELNEKGLWENGLSFGCAKGLEELVTKVARREGIGDDIAEGVKRMSEKFGGREFAIHVKGMELAAYDPRAAQGMGLGYATANRGGCHLNGGYLVVLEGLGLHVSGSTTRGKAGLTVFFQDLMEAASAAGSCLFTTYAVLPSILVKHKESILARIVFALFPSLGGLVGALHNHPGVLGLNAPGLLPHPYAYKLLTGTNMNIGRFVRAGERIYNLERLVNVRQGLSEDDTLPDRLKSPPRRDSGHDYVRLDQMLKKYYRIRGWDERGIPKRKRLKKLGLL
jgi:aldehyde:ferredoxin oxidoreductase